MNPKNPTALIFLVQALKGLEESKSHLTKAACELLWVAKSLASTTSSLVSDLNFDKNYPLLHKALNHGEKILDEIIEKIQPYPSENAKETENSVITRLPTRKKKISHPSSKER